MMAAAASLLVKSNVGAFLFRSSPRRRRIFMHGDWLAGFLVRLRRAVPTCRLRASTRACGAAHDRTTHCFKVSLCRADRSIGEITTRPRAVLPGRMEDVRFDRRGAGASLPKKRVSGFGDKMMRDQQP